MALGDVYHVKLEQTLLSQDVENDFFYEERLVYVDTNPTHAQTVAEAFVEQVLPLMQNSTQGELHYDRATVQNLFNPADGYTLLIGETGVGTTASDVLPTFNALGIELVGETTVTRRGAKRIAGMAEGVIVDGIITDPALVLVFAAMGDAFAAPLMIGTFAPDPVFSPCIVKRVRSGTPGNYVYRLPETTGEKVINYIAAALLDLVLTSQVSRKIGVGS